MSVDLDASGDGYSVRATGGVLWMTAQKWFSRILGLLTIVILTRLLDPTAFGLVAVAMSVVPFVYLLADLGFSTYLVQADNPGRTDYATAFWYSAAAGAALAVGLGAIGIPLESLLAAPGVAGIMWGLAPAVLFTALGAVPMALLRRQLRFRALAVQSFGAGVAGQIAAIVLALLGFGVWALVVQTVLTQLVTTIMVWAAARWLPTLDFSWAEFRRMFRYGLNVVAVEVVALTRVWAENAIIVATLGLTGLGYLSIAQKLIQTAQDLTATAVTPVSTVVFAQIRADVSRLEAAYGRAQSLIYAIVIPVMVFIVAGAPEIISLLFGSQWGQSVSPAQALAVAGILTVGASLDNGLFYGLGRPGAWLIYAVVIDALTVATTWVLAPFGLGAVALGFVGVALVATVVRWPLVAHRLRTRWWVLAVPFLQALGMGLVVGAAGSAVAALTRGLPGVVGLVCVGLTIAVVWVGAVRLFLPRTTAELRRLAGKAFSRVFGRRSKAAPAAQGTIVESGGDRHE